MENKSHAFAAGLFTLVFGLAIVAAILWFRRDTTVRVPYDVLTTGAVTGLSANAPVRYRGIPVGRVERIQFDRARPGDIVIRIEVNQDTPITKSTEASLGLQGVTGMAFLQLDEHGDDHTPLPSSAAHVTVLTMRPGLLEQLQHRGEALLAHVESLTASIEKLTDGDARAQYLATAKSFQLAADGIQHLSQQATPAVRALPQTLQRMDETLAATHRLVDSLNQPNGPLFANLNRMGLAADRASDTMDQLAARVGYDTLPKVNALADDVRTATRSVTRAADTVSDHPRSLLFGTPAAPPGPGEPGFAWPQTGVGQH